MHIINVVDVPQYKSIFVYGRVLRPIQNIELNEDEEFDMGGICGSFSSNEEVVYEMVSYSYKNGLV